MKRRKQVFIMLYVVLFLAAVRQIYPLDAKEIELFINGESYTREYPATLDEAISLIDTIALMHNRLDSSFLEYQKTSAEEKSSLQAITERLTNENESLQKELKTVEDASNEILIHTAREQYTSMILSSVGPVYDLNDNIFGLSVSIGALWKLPIPILKMYAGINSFINIYHFDARYKPRDIGLSLYAGFFLK
jgi:hypothetical protein